LFFSDIIKVSEHLPDLMMQGQLSAQGMPEVQKEHGPCKYEKKKSMCAWQKFVCSHTAFVVDNYLRVNRSKLLKDCDYVSQDFNQDQRIGLSISRMTSREAGFAHLRNWTIFRGYFSALVSFVNTAA